MITAQIKNVDGSALTLTGEQCTTIKAHYAHLRYMMQNDCRVDPALLQACGLTEENFRNLEVQWSDLSDAECLDGNDIYRPGGVQVWYWRDAHMQVYMEARKKEGYFIAHLYNNHPMLMPATMEELEKTHIKVGELKSSGLTVAGLDYYRSCMEVQDWSPRGEARTFIASLGLTHEEMGPGDIFVVDGIIIMLDCDGICRLNPEKISP